MKNSPVVPLSASKTIFPHLALAPATGVVFPPIRPVHVRCRVLLCADSGPRRSYSAREDGFREKRRNPRKHDPAYSFRSLTSPLTPYVEQFRAAGELIDEARGLYGLRRPSFFSLEPAIQSTSSPLNS